MKSTKLTRLAVMATFAVLTSPTFINAQELAKAAGHSPTALTESGVVIGRRTGTVNEFLGIPYAAPPVGALRWRPRSVYGVLSRTYLPGFPIR